MDIPLVEFHKVMKENLSSTETQLLNAKFEFGNELVSKQSFHVFWLNGLKLKVNKVKRLKTMNIDTQ